ncbi:unnamed protein product [Paramecium octaurelia]|uniref:Uncharacterized protein n=1 Tax=Paramecium octaurelia TaxID=43137 RepID=A0A8S1YIJ9_PAROT|nr:unnamed protein product [Paramecium octaurelia]
MMIYNNNLDCQARYLVGDQVISVQKDCRQQIPLPAFISTHFDCSCQKQQMIVNNM